MSEWLSAFSQYTWTDYYKLIENAPVWYQHWWLKLYQEAPQHVIVETFLILFIIWLVFIRKTIDPTKDPKKTNFSKKEEDWLIATWTPEPLVDPIDERSKTIANNMLTVEKVQGNYLKLKGYPKLVLNLSTFDFFGLSQSPTAKERARQALLKYGVGSCGPRGFYGTIDLHMEIENAIAKFMGVEEAAYYSDCATAVTSTIASYLKKGDLLIVDDGVSEAIRTGAILSRSTVVFYKHNDMNDLRKILKSISDDDKRLRRNAEEQRRFIVTEGLFRLTGDICPLKDIMDLKEEFKYRLILDETLSFGVIGGTGRGLTEHFGVDIKEIEVILISLETFLGSVGGMCIGSSDIVDHQRLSGAGYCFSASPPPFFAAAALDSLANLERNGRAWLEALQLNSSRLARGLREIPGFKLASNDATPVMHLTLQPTGRSWEEDERILTTFSDECLKLGIGLCNSKLQSEMLKSINKEAIRPSLRVCATTTLTNAEIDKTISVIRAVANKLDY